MQNLKGFVGYLPSEISAGEMSAIEINASYLGVSQYQLMENAGRAVAEKVKSLVKEGGKVFFACGTGNNGGDGFAAARFLEGRYDIDVAVVGNASAIKAGAALMNYRVLEKSPLINISEARQGNLPNILKDTDVIVDAIYGTGFHGTLPEAAKRAIRQMNASGRKIVAVDVPSGVDLETGNGAGAVNADYTVTMHKMKQGLASCKNAGKIYVADIGIPFAAELLAGPGDVVVAQPKRKFDSTKKDNGYVVVFGGSGTYHGAPALAVNAAYASLAALRSSAGYVVTYVPDTVIDSVRAVSPNIIVKRLEQSNMENIKRDIEKCDSIAIGMGMGREESGQRLASEIIRTATGLGKKIVVDADALYAIGEIGKLGANAVITPNEHEFSRIYKQPGRNLREKIENAIAFSRKLECTVVLKGSDTVITDGKRLKVNVTESAALATMGTGDVLSGIIAAYASKGGIFSAAVAGVYLHARIGDVLHIEKGDHIIATDVIDSIPRVLLEIAGIA